MDYVKKFLRVEGVIGQGAFGRVLVTSPIQNQQQLQVHQQNEHRSMSESSTSCDENQSDKDQQPVQTIFPAPQINSASPDSPIANLVVSSPPKFALKCVHPMLSPQRLANELRHLRDLEGKHNVVRVHTAHLYKGFLYIVMEMIEHDRFVDIVASLDLREIVMYMQNLLVALEHVHAHHIIHRDIKPANFLFNRREKKFLLVDFGLAQKCRASAQSQRRCNMHTHSIHQGPSRYLINLTPLGSPKTANLSAKRQLTEALNPNEHFNHDFKKLRVSHKNPEESKEPLKLTVGAYESPITNNDSENNRRTTKTTGNQQFSTPTVPSRRIPPRRKCECLGKSKTCSICTRRPEPNASKSGTPGYKAPEILFRYPHQTTAIDIWSAGVIFACLLSGHAPFFRDVDDRDSVVEIVCLLGSKRIADTFKSLYLKLNADRWREPVDLAQFFRTMRAKGKDKLQIDIPDAAFDLLNRMLDPNPKTRITAEDCLKHPFLNPS